MSDIAFYFGCWDRPGHYLFDAFGRNCERRVPADFPVEPVKLDGGFTPKGVDESQGVASLHHVNGWTVISFWDRTVDHRRGSNSSFVLRGVLTFDEAITAAKESFDTIFKRFTFPLVEQGT